MLNTTRATVWKLIVITWIRIILCMGTANGRRCYNATSSPIGSAHTHDDLWFRYLDIGFLLTVSPFNDISINGWVGTWGLFLFMVINLLAPGPGKFKWNVRHVIVKQIFVIDEWFISCEIALTWKPQDLTDDKSTLVQVMFWCPQAPSHYLNQCWPSSLSLYGNTRPQWVNCLKLGHGSVFVSIVSWVLYSFIHALNQCHITIFGIA